MNTDASREPEPIRTACAKCGAPVIGLAAEGPNITCSNCTFPAIGMEPGADRRPSCEAIEVSMARG